MQVVFNISHIGYKFTQNTFCWLDGKQNRVPFSSRICELPVMLIGTLATHIGISHLRWFDSISSLSGKGWDLRPLWRKMLINWQSLFTSYASPFMAQICQHWAFGQFW